ncbi:response regulator transcription factor [Pseudarthrobacter raffinosi]|uniref:response regulator transcription factor n=1 Tax=Pseudarthrobacter raffinosi TaxID=2953651 RepID=UPI00208EF146|nr:response regulator transcription factor [Pseudarthrobacter sp. MDT3-9]MCO4253538.1 response regulator transcription factor [Pseudarthrobacter sp. MDT3-9]
MIRFCVIDDHEVVQDGLWAMARREEDLELVGVTSRLHDAYSLLQSTAPDIVLLDLQLDGESSIETCSVLTETFSATKVILFSSYGNAALLKQAIHAGASGYALKDTNTRKMPDILREVFRTGSYFDSRLSGSLLRESLNPKNAQAFSDRELLIVSEISRGSNNYDIAEKLHVSPHTVKFHISAMLKRHNLQRRAELVHLAMTMHLLE